MNPLVRLLLLMLCAVSPASVASEESSSESNSIDTNTTTTNNKNNLRWWPHRNSSSPANNNNKTSSSCSTFSSCGACNDASWCHWCDGDQTCHTMGSLHGCVRGSNCLPPPPPVAHNDSCSIHATCADCALSSRTCHWCAHDNACHLIGSVYGCVAGVDCYSNDRCKRREPEPIEQLVVTQIGMLPLLIILSIGLLGVSCVSMCFGTVAGLKGAYEDLWNLQEATLGRMMMHDADEERDAPQEQEEGGEDGDAHTQTQEHTSEYVPLGEGSDHEDTDDLHTPLLTSIAHSPATTTTTAALLHPFQPRHVRRLFRSCTICYLLVIISIISCSIASVRFYPKAPTYNVCNDSVAWKSIIDSLTNMKATADFEILVSVSNPNYFSVALDAGSGSFTHNGAFVGTYDIPPVVAEPLAITDLLIVAHLAPDKWDALGLVAEYYRGRLVLRVDAEATIRVPALADYTFTAEMSNLIVNVNEQSERHLCACPTWSEVSEGHGENDAGEVMTMETEWINVVEWTTSDGGMEEDRVTMVEEVVTFSTEES